MPSTTDGCGIELLAAPAGVSLYFARRGITPAGWCAGPGAWFPTHRHGQAKHLFVTRGSITLNGLELEAPMGVRIPAGLRHEARAGRGGVECLEGFELDGLTASGSEPA